jgi:hypothetical protein
MCRALEAQVTPFREMNRQRCPDFTLPSSLMGFFIPRGSCVLFRPSLLVFYAGLCCFSAHSQPVAWKMSEVLTRFVYLGNVICKFNFLGTDRSTGMLYGRIWACSGDGPHNSSPSQVEPWCMRCMSAANEGWRWRWWKIK